MIDIIFAVILILINNNMILLNLIKLIFLLLFKNILL